MNPGTDHVSGRPRQEKAMTEAGEDASGSGPVDEPGAETSASQSAATPERQPVAPFVEVLVVILLSLATVSTAWSAYQATRWSGDQAISSGRADALRTESTKLSNRANALSIIDVQLFTGWVDAVNQDDTRRADFLRTRFRDEFKPAFDAWHASAPQGVIPAGSPFDLPEYTLETEAESDRLTREAAANVEASREANQRGDNFILVTVLFATVLFFGGTVGKIQSVRIRRMLLVLAGTVWVGGMVVMLLMPQNVGF
jgi:hypothetical protein